LLPSTAYFLGPERISKRAGELRLKKYRRVIWLIIALLLVYAAPLPVGPGIALAAEESGKIANDDLTKAVVDRSKDALKSEVSQIGGRIVNAVRALFVTFFVIAVIFMGLQAAGGGLKDPRKVELIKGGGLSATLSAVLVYKADTIVAFVLNLVGVSVSEVLK